MSENNTFNGSWDNPSHYDGFAVTKLKNLIAFLETCDPVKKQQQIVINLRYYTTAPETFALFRHWFATTMRPDIQQLGIDTARNKLIFSYSMVPTDFNEEELKKISLYIECFNEILRSK